jgi:hypothetical protein
MMPALHSASKLDSSIRNLLLPASGGGGSPGWIQPVVGSIFAKGIGC